MTDSSPSNETLSDDSIAALLSTMPLGLVVIAPDNTIWAINDPGLELLGLSSEVAVGTAVFELLADPAETLLLDESLRNAREGLVTRRSFQFRAGPMLRGLNLRCWPQDTTSGMMVLATLETSTAPDQVRQIRSLIAHSPSGLARLVGSLTLTDVNERWTEITGQTPQEASGEGWLERIDPDGREEFLEALRDAVADRRGLIGRLRVISTDGTYRWLDVSVTPLDQVGASLLGFEDSTEDIGAARRAAELSRVLEATTDSVGILTPDGKSFVWANESLTSFFGVDVVGTDTSARFDSPSINLLIDIAVPHAHQTGNWRGELTLVSSTGHHLPVSAMLVTHIDASGGIEAISLVARDISELRAAQAQLIDSENRLHALVEHSADLLVLINAEGNISYVAPSVERDLEHPPGSLLGVDVLELVHPDDLDRAYELAAAVVESPEETAASTAELRISHGNGSYRHLEVRATNLLDNPAVGGVVLNGIDITDRVAATAQLEEQAYHDDLTGLPNRALLVERLRDSLRRARERRLLVGLLFLDLDRFNVVNESLGHTAGDELLNEVAERIGTVVRPGDIVARLGGDEFAVVISDMLRRGDAVVAARRLRKALTQPIQIGEQSAVITTSIGIAIADGGEQPQDLLRDADTALHRAKQRGRDLAVVFDDNLRDQAVRRLEVENKLREAIDTDSLVVHYQPVLSTADGHLAGAEALVRLRDPNDGSLVMPGAFIDVAEDSGLIAQLGHQVLVQSIRQTAEWTRMEAPGQVPMTIAVNVSARQLFDPEYPHIVSSELAAAGLAPQQLSLELTESALIDGNPTTEASLQRLRELGVRIGLDDFGTGFSSLAYLKRFPISFLKIDRSFVDGLGSDEDDSAIVRATIALAKGLNLRVVAEGVETREQLAMLTELQCDLAQGYLFSRPVDADKFETYLGMRWTS